MDENHIEYKGFCDKCGSLIHESSNWLAFDAVTYIKYYCSLCARPHRETKKPQVGLEA